MNREDIIRMAREAGFASGLGSPVYHKLNAFAALVAAAERNSWPAEMEAMERQVNILTDALAQAKAEEREACAKVCDELHWPWHMGDNSGPKECAAAIRARGQA